MVTGQAIIVKFIVTAAFLDNNSVRELACTIPIARLIFNLSTCLDVKTGIDG
jgi:hypothetical protein